MSSTTFAGKHRASSARGTVARRAVGGAMVGGAMTAAFIGFGSIGTAQARAVRSFAHCPIPWLAATLFGNGADTSSSSRRIYDPSAVYKRGRSLPRQPADQGCSRSGRSAMTLTTTRLIPTATTEAGCSVAAVTVTARPQRRPTWGLSQATAAMPASSAATAGAAATAPTRPTLSGVQLRTPPGWRSPAVVRGARRQRRRRWRRRRRQQSWRAQIGGDNNAEAGQGGEGGSGGYYGIGGDGGDGGEATAVGTNNADGGDGGVTVLAAARAAATAARVATPPRPVESQLPAKAETPADADYRR